MNNDQQSDGVWLSREEYERLRAAESVQEDAGLGGHVSLQPAYGTATATSTALSAAEVSTRNGQEKSNASYILTAVMVVCALLSYTMPIFTIVFIVVGVLAIIKASTKKDKKAVPLTLSIVTLCIGLIVIAPMLLLFVLIGWFQVNCWFDASACRSV